MVPSDPAATPSTAHWYDNGSPSASTDVEVSVVEVPSEISSTPPIDASGAWFAGGSIVVDVVVDVVELVVDVVDDVVDVVEVVVDVLVDVGGTLVVDVVVDVLVVDVVDDVEVDVVVSDGATTIVWRATSVRSFESVTRTATVRVVPAPSVSVAVGPVRVVVTGHRRRGPSRT